MLKRIRQFIMVLMVVALTTFSIVTGEGVPGFEDRTMCATVSDIMSE